MGEKNAFPNIDPRIRAVGVSRLRDMNSTFLKHMKDTVFLIQEQDKPLAVLVSYELYLSMQQDQHLL